MRLMLDCGVEVFVTSCHFTTTYSGLLEGVPNRRINDLIVENAKTTQVFGADRPTHLISPVIDESGKYPSLPPYIFSAWLDDPFEESHLVVVWFRGDFADFSISQVIGDAVKPLLWHDLAKRYWI